MEFSQEIFLDRYAIRDPDGNLLESRIEQMWERVARFAASAEKTEDQDKWYQEFYSILEGFKFVPAGRILASAGQARQLVSANCFVIPSPEDSREGILRSLTEWVEIQSRGGGVGMNISSLRPQGSYVAGVNGTSSGPLAWMSLFSVATKDVVQQGGSRRGAGMLMMNVDHPDIEAFIEVKKTPGALEGANLSVCISDAFMESVRKEELWNLIWKGEIRKQISALELWGKICQSAWESGEPGIYFIDRANQMNPTFYSNKIEATNPCGEQPLPPYGVCNLGSINLTAFYNEDTSCELTRLVEVTKLAVRFMDNIIDLSYYPLPEIEKEQKKNRRIGIGTMGLADLLLRSKVRYGSSESLTIINSIYGTLRDAAYSASAELAAEKGAFPGYHKDYLVGVFMQRLPPDVHKVIAAKGIRNSAILSQAPTGTISILAGCSSGIEPIFSLKHKRVDRTGEHIVKHWILDEFPEEPLPNYIVTANQVEPLEHVKVQAEIQKYMDSSVSKTVNLPNSATVDNVGYIYSTAYDMGLKGLTVYRDGSRLTQVLTDIPPDREINQEKVTLPNIPSNTLNASELALSAPITSSERRRHLPDERNSITHKFVVGGQDGYVTVGLFEDGTPGEIFLHFNKQGSTVAGLADALAVVVSLALQYGTPLESIIEKMTYRKFEPSGLTANKEIPFATSLVDYIFRWMGVRFGEEYFARGHRKESNAGDTCPTCGSQVIMQEGCLNCQSCGWSRCM